MNKVFPYPSISPPWQQDSSFAPLTSSYL